MFGDLTRVGANSHASQAYYNLRKVNGAIGTIQSRISTGKRINSAEDDTSGYALSKNLESRRRGLSQALDNVGTAKNVLKIAEGAYQSQMSILLSLKEKAIQAADGSFSSAQRTAINDEYTALVKEIQDISDQAKFNDNTLFGTTMTFQVGEDNSNTLAVSFDSSTSAAIGEDNTDVSTSTVKLSTAASASAAISKLDTAITSLAKSIQEMGDFNARLSSKEDSLSLAISNTEATRSRIEDADFAKEQMNLMKLSILQQTTMASFAQANSSAQMVLSLFQ
jgi:flagellin|tara:strand:+ start:432 stop:1271 length:840 start_codon:yes stop_codon:yes gene_type:complete